MVKVKTQNKSFFTEEEIARMIESDEAVND